MSTSVDPSGEELTFLVDSIELTAKMSPRTVVHSDKGLDSPLFSQAIICNGMVYVSGNIGMDYATMKEAEGSVTDRTVSVPRIAFGARDPMVA